MNKDPHGSIPYERFGAAFGESLAESRALAGLSQVRMAEQLGLTQDEYERAERGEHILDLRQARYAAQQIGVPFSRLVAKTEAALNEGRTFLLELPAALGVIPDDEIVFVAQGYGRLINQDQKNAVCELLKVYLGAAE